MEDFTGISSTQSVLMLNIFQAFLQGGAGPLLFHRYLKSWCLEWSHLGLIIVYLGFRGKTGP